MISKQIEAKVSQVVISNQFLFLIQRYNFPFTFSTALSMFIFSFIRFESHVNLNTTYSCHFSIAQFKAKTQIAVTHWKIGVINRAGKGKNIKNLIPLTVPIVTQVLWSILYGDFVKISLNWSLQMVIHRSIKVWLSQKVMRTVMCACKEAWILGLAYFRLILMINYWHESNWFLCNCSIKQILISLRSYPSQKKSIRSVNSEEQSESGKVNPIISETYIAAVRNVFLSKDWALNFYKPLLQWFWMVPIMKHSLLSPCFWR